MPHAYTEDQLVAQPAVGLFAELGWTTVSALEEVFGPAPSELGRSRGDKTHSSPAKSQSLLTSSPTVCLGRETKGEVVLVSRLRAALERLNPALPTEALTAAMDELTRDRSAMSLEAANREVYLLLKEGIRVSIADTEPHPSSLPKGEGVPAQNSCPAPLYLWKRGQWVRVRSMGKGGNNCCDYGWWIGSIQRTTMSCWSASLASPARSTPAGRIWSASSTACRCVFWQTQGSGKSYSMVFFAQKVLRKVPGNWTFVIATDRVELDDQIAKTFKATGAVSEAEGDQCHAASGAHLRELLRGNHRYVFTLIHKFRPETSFIGRCRGDEAHSSAAESQSLLTSSPTSEEVMPVLCDRPDVIVLADEAHRSQYILTRDDRLETVAQDIVRHFLGRGFVGKAMVVSIDKATALKMHDKVRKHWAAERERVEKEIAELTRYPVAADVSPLKSSAIGKLEPTHVGCYDVVASGVSRITILRRAYEKPHKNRELEPTHVGCYDPEKRRELQRRLDVLKTTDMALIVSPGQNEIQQMQARGQDNWWRNCGKPWMPQRSSVRNAR